MDTGADVPSQTFKWYEVWYEVYFHPGLQTFSKILADPKILAQPARKQARAFIWVVLTGAMAGFLIEVPRFAAASDFDGLGLGIGAFAGIVSVFVPILMHGIANWAGGQGERYDFVYCFTAISAPATLITGLLIAAGQISVAMSPYLGQAILILCAAWLGYPLVLVIMAIKGVETLSVRKALGVIFYPAVPLITLGLCNFSTAFARSLVQGPALIIILIVVIFSGYIFFGKPFFDKNAKVGGKWRF